MSAKLTPPDEPVPKEPSTVIQVQTDSLGAAADSNTVFADLLRPESRSENKSDFSPISVDAWLAGKQ